MAAWSVAHGAPMVLGSWGFLAWGLPRTEFHAAVEEAAALLRNDSRIVEASWWSYEQLYGGARYLANADGSLTPEGHTYAKIAGAGNTLSVSVAGPTELMPSGVGIWSANVSGAPGPYTYQWYLDGAAVGNNATYSGVFAASESHTLSVSVSSAGAAWGIAPPIQFTVVYASGCDYDYDCPPTRVR